MYEKGKSRYKKPPADALRSRLCICQLTIYVYMICTNSIVNSIIVETYVPVKSCRKIFEGGRGQTVSDGRNAKEKLPQGPAHRGSLAGAYTLLRWCKCRVKVIHKSVLA